MNAHQRRVARRALVRAWKPMFSSARRIGKKTLIKTWNRYGYTDAEKRRRTDQLMQIMKDSERMAREVTQRAQCGVFYGMDFGTREASIISMSVTMADGIKKWQAIEEQLRVDFKTRTRP